MLAIKRSTGATPGVNLKIPLHTDKEACKPGIHPAFETQGRHHRSPKQGYQWPQKKDLSPPLFTVLNFSCICLVIWRLSPKPSYEVCGVPSLICFLI